MTAAAYHMTTPHSQGIGAAKSMFLALEEAGIHNSQVDYFNLHATSMPVGDIKLNAVASVLKGLKIFR